MKTKTINDITDDDSQFILFCLILMSDVGKQLWTSNEIESAIEIYGKYYSNIRYNDLTDKYGKEEICKKMDSIVKYKLFENATISSMIAKNNENICDDCGGAPIIYKYPFYLCKETTKKKDLTNTFISIGVSMITLPLLGSGIFAFPGSDDKINAIKLDHKLCAKCKKNHSGLFGYVSFSKEELMKNPAVLLGEFTEYKNIRYYSELK
jgi:hypothetical protein